MLVVRGGPRQLLAALLLAMLWATVLAADAGPNIPVSDAQNPIDGSRNERHPVQTCGTVHRLDDITEISDDTRRCLIPPRPGIRG